VFTFVVIATIRRYVGKVLRLGLPRLQFAIELKGKNVNIYHPI